MKTLYFDCFAGASGDMILGALVALGVDREKLLNELSKLDISDFDVSFETVDRSGISATKAHVAVPHEHSHRHLHHIEKIINESGLGESVKTRAVDIFKALAAAEAKVHGIEINKVHFHEVGAMDAIIDVVGACIGFEMLGVEKFAASKIHVGSGFVNMAHGKFPVPPPAVAELLQTKNVPIYQTEIVGELLTPTGAAIIATVCDDFGAMDEMKVERTGYGAGGREYKDFPNVLRLMLGETAMTVAGPEVDSLIVLETNLDDIAPQNLGFVMERAFELGAYDCWFTPIQMKKNRPATMISILCSPDKKDIFSRLLYSETTTLGIRIREIERVCLPREIVKIDTEFGEIEIKVARLDGKIINKKPEFDQLRTIAREKNISLIELQGAVEAAIRDKVI